MGREAHQPRPPCSESQDFSEKKTIALADVQMGL